MSKVYAGTSGWAYPSWKPEFYPAKLAAAKFLGYYASRLNSVELNYTFRRFPTEKLLTSWMEATPPDFKFAVKAHQTITHIKRLRDSSSFTADFLGALEPLREAGLHSQPDPTRTARQAPRQSYRGRQVNLRSR